VGFARSWAGAALRAEGQGPLLTAGLLLKALCGGFGGCFPANRWHVRLSYLLSSTPPGPVFLWSQPADFLISDRPPAEALVAVETRQPPRARGGATTSCQGPGLGEGERQRGAEVTALFTDVEGLPQ